MREPLALKYRPTTFEDMVGQRYTAAILKRMVETDEVPPGLLFSGPSGVGKTTAARILASALDAGDVIEVDAASNGGVTEVRKLLDTVRYSLGGAYRIIILDEAQAITPQGFLALLKTLEEPPENTIFVLCSTEPYKIPENVKSRLMEFEFKAVTSGDVASRLASIAVREEIRVERDLVLHLANRADGNLRTAVQSLDKVSRAGIETLEKYIELAGEGDTGPQLLAALMTNDHDRIFQIVEEQLTKVSSPAQLATDLIATIRDLFVIKAGGTLPEGQGFEIRKQLASRLDQEKLMLAMRVLWELRTKVRAAEDPRGNLDIALVLIAEAISRGNPARVIPAVHSDKSNKPAPRKLSLAEMQRG
ncbi:ASCE ATPase [Microbacterium phage Magritte]|nr:ASCE ATPase [Microbacterium phage Magritte]